MERTRREESLSFKEKMGRLLADARAGKRQLEYRDIFRYFRPKELKEEELDRVLTPAAPPETISKEDFRKEIKNINDILKNPEEPAEKKGLLLRSIVDRIVYEKASGTMYFDFFVS